MKIVALLLLPIGILAHLPFVVLEMQWMWNSTHYGFFPFAIAAFVWLVWERLKETEVTPGLHISKYTSCLLIVNVCLLALATLANSHWLGWVSFILFLWTAAHIILPSEIARQIRQPFLILLLIIPLPLGLNESLVIQLQKFASRQGSLMLDFVGLQHGLDGVVVRLPTRSFMVDDACSGIHSLYSAVTAMLVFAVYCRYSTIRTLLTFLQTVFWVLAVNSMRVFVVVYTSQRWNLGLDGGLRHDALGFVCYAGILLLALSTDQAMRYLARIPTEEERRSRRVSAWGRMREWFNKPFPDSLARIAGIGFAILFLAVGSLAAAQTLRSAPNGPAHNFDDALAYPFSAENMPASINGWTRVNFEPKERETNNAFGATSFIWTYEKNGIVAQFSIDGAYPEFHDLYYCYSSLDWGLRQPATNIPIDGSVNETENAVATQLQLYKEDDQALVLFTCVDSDGKVVEPPLGSGTTMRRIVDRLRSGLLLGNDKAAFVPPVIQFQIYTSSISVLYDHEQVEIQKLFGQLRELASEQIEAYKRS